ncbi:MAG: hypothetical protein AB9834_11305 [Lentimicrobium sp.]
MIRFKFRILFTVLLISLQLPLFAQVNKPVRLEIPVKDDSEIYKVVTCEDNGIAIIYLSSDTDESGRLLWITAFLDRNLKEIWRKPFALPRGFSLAEAQYSNSHLVGFWHAVKGSASENLRIVDLNVKDTTIREVTFTVPEKSELSHFGICSHFALAGLNTKNDQSMLIRYDLTSGAVSSVKQDIEGNVVIESMNIDADSGVVSTILRTSGSSKQRAYYLVKSDSRGQKVSELKLGKFDDKNLINTAFSLKINADSDLIIGSYGNSSRTKVIDGYESVGVASTGFFSILVQNNTIVNTTFYEFSDFQNFFRYLRKPSDLSVRRGSSKSEKGSKEITIDHDLLAHDVFKWKDNFVFVAEAYYPEYRTVTTMVYDYYGRPYPSTYSVFEGFRYLTTFIAGFDSAGAMKWNNDLELRNMLTQNLKQKVLAWEDSDGLVLSYSNDGKIASKILPEGSAKGNILFTDIAPLSSRDKIYKDSNSNMVFWYGNYFLAYGYQNIRNSYQNDRNNKNVFYLNKIAFR